MDAGAGPRCGRDAGLIGDGGNGGNAGTDTDGTPTGDPGTGGTGGTLLGANGNAGLG